MVDCESETFDDWDGEEDVGTERDSHDEQPRVQERHVREAHMKPVVQAA